MAQVPDNVGVPATVPYIGMGANYLAANGYDPTNYVLQDIATVSPWTIGADGLHAVLTSGGLPASMVRGQFVRTTTHPELHRIMNLGALYRVVAATDAFAVGDTAPGTISGSWVVSAGGGWQIRDQQAALIGPASGTARHTTDIGTSDYEVEATLTELTGTGNIQGGVIARKDATATQTYWRFGTSLAPTAWGYRLAAIVNGALQPGIIDVPMVPNVGDVITLRNVGNLHQGYVNGILVAETTNALIPTGTFGGIAGSTTAGQIVKVDNWTARTTSNATGIVWNGLPHAEAGATNKTLIVTFKGTARDGTDPGADLVTVEAMTRGVRDPALLGP
jgi:hypothetical protein